MKLSNLVAYNRSLELSTVDNINDLVADKLNSLTNKLESMHVEDFREISECSDNILNQISALNTHLNNYKKKIDLRIQQQEKVYLLDSYKIYEEMKNDSPEYILNRINETTVDNSKDFEDRISLYSNWQYAGLYIRPGKNKFINKMLASDPLYVADESLDLLNPVKTRWTPEYQSRIRYKIISDDQDIIFTGMPKNQLGLIVVTNFFNFKPFEIIKKYLTEFKELLKPGGFVIFTYNNCDLPGAIRNVENRFNCYTPARLIKDFISGLNYELVNSVETPSGLNWLEIKNLGELESMRGGQALAKIIAQQSDII